jgi:signal transduction histidine kinase
MRQRIGSNTIKYSPKRGEILLRLRRVPEGVVLTVHDSGIGLPAGEEERIFEPFRRTSNALAQSCPASAWGCTSVARSQRPTVAPYGPKARARGRVPP